MAGGKEGGILNGVNPLQVDLSLLLIQIIIIISTCRLLAFGLRYMRQPTVIAEVIGGILLGPSVFGLIPGYMETIFPPKSLPYLSVIANLGLIFYLFLVGLELDLGMMRARLGQSLAISLAGMIAPFVMSIGTSYFLWWTYLQELVPFATVMLFLGVCMSITAFPVLARILGELHLFSTDVGIQAISAAAIDDAAAWALLALVIGIVSASTPLNALYIVLMAVAFAMLMLFGARRLLGRIFDRGVNADGTISQWVVVVVILVILLASLATDIIGIHAIFGAFLTGLSIPRGRGFEIMLTEKLEDFVTVLFLPLFFAFSGLRTKLGLLNDGTAWGMVFLVILTACSGKILGCSFAARAIKMNWRESFSIGILMNTKGLVELVVLNVGLDAHVINETVFAIMVLMAIFTTLLTTPLISFVYPPKYYRKAAEEELSLADSDMSTSPLEIYLAKHFRPLMCLPGLRFVPTMMNMLRMIKPAENSTDRPRRVHAARVIEITDRTSTIMKAAQHLESLQSDPVLQVFKTFGQMNKMDIEPHISFTTAEEIPADLCEVADSNHLNTIVIPWHHPNDVNAALNVSMNYKHHHLIVRGLLSKFEKSVAVVLDRGISTGEARQLKPPKILVPFFGGPDDREALLFALSLRHLPGTKIVVLRIKVAPGSRRKDKGKSDASSPLQITVEGEAIEMAERGHSPDGNVDISVGYHDEEDDRLMKKLQEWCQADPTVATMVDIVDVEEQPSRKMVAAVVKKLRQDPSFTMAVFGYMGTSWVNMVLSSSTEALNQHTTNSTKMRSNLSHVYQQYLASTGTNTNLHQPLGPSTSSQARNEALNAGTVRSILSAFGVGGGHASAPQEDSESHDNLDVNQYTIPAGAAAAGTLNLDELRGPMESTLAVPDHRGSHLPDKDTLKILGEVGLAIWKAQDLHDISVVSVRYVRH